MDLELELLLLLFVVMKEKRYYLPLLFFVFWMFFVMIAWTLLLECVIECERFVIYYMLSYKFRNSFFANHVYMLVKDFKSTKLFLSKYFHILS